MADSDAARASMIRRPRRVLLALAALPILLAAACRAEREPSRTGPFAGQKITFSVSVAEEERRAIQHLLERFAGRTGAAVSLVSVTAETLPEKLKVEVRAGRPSIDLFAQADLIIIWLITSRPGG